MLKRKWISRDLKTYEDWLEIRDGIKALSVEIAAFDTETTGLHIKLDRPFLFQFGFLDPRNSEKGFTFLVDFEENERYRDIIEEWHEIVKTSKKYIAHNVKFDLHMLENIGMPYRTENLSDTSFYIRYGTDAVHEEEGGAPMALKDFTARYIDPNAKYHEKLLASERSQIAKNYNIKLKNALASAGTPPSQYNAKSYTLKVIDEMFKDKIFDMEDLPEKARVGYLNWLHSLPEYLQEKIDSIVESDMIRYNTLNREALHKYAHLDIVYVLEIYEALAPVVEHRGNINAIKLEESLILPLFDMENTGFLADKEYLETCRIKVRDYIKKRRLDFQALCQRDLKIGQSKEIVKVFKEVYDTDVTSTNAKYLDLLRSQIVRENPDNPVIKLIDTMAELRTLEKWYAVYILRFQKDLKHSDRLYTSINSVGAISGRVSSDFQQFPKDAITDKDGNELFHPRKVVLVPPNCKGLLYLDYSQIELRFQAMYTILVGTPDMNMCRAYMPYKCHLLNGHQFNYNSPSDIKSWNDDWYTDEDNTKWIPTDVHAATTEAAGFSKDDPNFKYYRKHIGKPVNFGKNYGASLAKIIEMFPDKTYDECVRIDAAYYKAFPGVKNYHQYCFNRAQNFPYTSNLFGIRYYNANGHKLRNILVQGSAAHFLKYRIRALWEFIQENNLKSRMQMQIHDELVFEINKDDPPVLYDFKRIMEDWPDALVPVVAEAEYTTTVWAEKGEPSEELCASI